MNNLNRSDFEKVEMRVGTVIDVVDFPEARKPSFKLTIDFGEKIGIKKTSAQVTVLYKKKDLLNKQVVAVINFPKKQIGKTMSSCLVLGAAQSGDVTLIKPLDRVINGSVVS